MPYQYFDGEEFHSVGSLSPPRRSECSEPSWDFDLEGSDATVPKLFLGLFSSLRASCRGSSVCTQAASSATKGYTGHRQKPQALQDGGASITGAAEPI